MVSNDVLGAALEAVAAEGGERPAPSEKGRVAALIAAINAALAMQATLTSKSDERAKRRALTVAASTLTLLASCGGSQPAMPPPEVSVAAVVHRPVTEWDEFSGRIEHRRRASSPGRRRGFGETRSGRTSGANMATCAAHRRIGC